MRTPASHVAESCRHLAGVLIVTSPGRLEALVTQINEFPGCEVHHCQHERDRCVAVLESEDADGHEDALRRIRALEGVVVAAPVFHYVDMEGVPK